MIEGGLSDTSMGKMILAACFITDLGRVLALGGLFANFNIWLLVFVAVTVLVLWFMPRWTQSPFPAPELAQKWQPQLPAGLVAPIS